MELLSFSFGLPLEDWRLDPIQCTEGDTSAAPVHQCTTLMSRSGNPATFVDAAGKAGSTCDGERAAQSAEATDKTSSASVI